MWWHECKKLNLLISLFFSSVHPAIRQLLINGSSKSIPFVFLFHPTKCDILWPKFYQSVLNAWSLENAHSLEYGHAHPSNCWTAGYIFSHQRELFPPITNTNSYHTTPIKFNQECPHTPSTPSTPSTLQPKPNSPLHQRERERQKVLHCHSQTESRQNQAFGMAGETVQVVKKPKWKDCYVVTTSKVISKEIHKRDDVEIVEEEISVKDGTTQWVNLIDIINW